MTPLALAIERLSGSLVAQYETIFSHAGNKGDSREAAVIAFLRKVCPARIGFSKGEVFDQHGASSGEVDIILYDEIFSPVFTDGTSKILAPIESTFGAIEVKSTLTTKELRDSIAKAKRYWALDRPPHPKNAIPIVPGGFVSLGNGLGVSATTVRPLFGLFAFKNDVARETILSSLHSEAVIDFVVVPGEFIAIRNGSLDLFRLNKAPPSDILINSPSSVAIWVLLLQICISNMRLNLVDIRSAFNALIGAGPTFLEIDGTDI